MVVDISQLPASKYFAQKLGGADSPSEKAEKAPFGAVRKGSGELRTPRPATGVSRALGAQSTICPETITELIRFRFLRCKNYVTAPEINSPRGPGRQKLWHRYQ